jgi:hypothetical protein
MAFVFEFLLGMKSWSWKLSLQRSAESSNRKLGLSKRCRFWSVCCPHLLELCHVGLFQYGSQWQPERAPQPIVDPQQQIEQSQPSFAGAPPFFSSGVPFNPSNPAQQFLANSLPSLYPSLAGPPFLAPIPAPALPTATPPLAQLPTVTRTVAEHSPYPLFPPGLIPGMVRKMQIGSGVPYSALSPLPVLLNLSMSFETLLLTGAEPGMLELGSIVEL